MCFVALLSGGGGGCAIERVGVPSSEPRSVDRSPPIGEDRQLRREARSLDRRIEQRLTQMRDADDRRVAALKLQRYSGPLDTDDDGSDDRIRLHVVPVDRGGAFLPVVGGVRITAFRGTDDGEDAVVCRTFLASLEPAYRDGFLGTHYELDLPLPADLPAGAHELRVKVQMPATDAAATVEQVMVVRVGR